MLFSVDWLRTYATSDAPVEEIAARLTAAGFHVETTTRRSDDTLLDVDVTTNRPDAMCHFGLARELAAVLEVTLVAPSAVVAEGEASVESAAQVAVDDRELCPRYAARVVRGVEVAPSPGWLADRLRSIGLRPINNVVDVTNFVLWELGQPLHAFDLARLAGGRIRVRRAAGGEVLRTLDGVVRELSPDLLVIADAEKPVALAGVIGGAETEVGSTTVDVLVESAHFLPAAVRRSARACGLHTDASHRFERGADPGICRLAADRAARLLAEVAGGEVLAGALDVAAAAVDAWRRRGSLDLARLAAFAGATIGAAEVERVLSALGFEHRTEGDGHWQIVVPSWRYYDFDPRAASDEDAAEVYPADLYEEILRIHGFDAIPTTLPALAGVDAGTNAAYDRRGRLRRRLAALGFLEVVSYSFLSAVADAAAPSLLSGPAVEVANPLSELYARMRRSLLPGLLESARYNLRRGARGLRLFEVGTVFAHADGSGIEELEAIGVIACGELGEPWDARCELDLFALKGAVENLARAFGVTLETRPVAAPQGMVPGTAGELWANGRRVGLVGRLVGDSDEPPLYAAELAVAALAAGERENLEVALPSRFPGIAADLTLTHSATVRWSEIAEVVARRAGSELAAFHLKDRYRGAGVPDGAVKTTIAFDYNAHDRSLTQEEVNELQVALGRELEERFGLEEER